MNHLVMQVVGIYNDLLRDSMDPGEHACAAMPSHLANHVTG